MSRLTNLELNDVNENNLAKLCAITQEYQSSLFEDEILEL